MKVLVIKKDTFGVIEYEVDSIDFDDDNIYLYAGSTTISISKEHHLLFFIN